MVVCEKIVLSFLRHQIFTEVEKMFFSQATFMNPFYEPVRIKYSTGVRMVRKFENVLTTSFSDMFTTWFQNKILYYSEYFLEYTQHKNRNDDRVLSLAQWSRLWCMIFRKLEIKMSKDDILKNNLKIEHRTFNLNLFMFYVSQIQLKSWAAAVNTDQKRNITL